MRQGQFDMAISDAKAVLTRSGLSNKDRYSLMRTLAEAEEQLAALRHYVDIKAAIRAYQDLHREFPRLFGSDQLHWKIAWLNWSGRDFDRADIAAQEVLKNRGHGTEVKKAALIHAQNLIRKRKFSSARSILLTYFGLNPSINATEEAQGLAWLAVIDAAEHRDSLAYKTMQKVYAEHPEVVEGSPVVYAAYIRLLTTHVDTDVLLQHISHFVAKHIMSPEAPAIRLMQADILAAHKQKNKAKTIYGILADRHINTVIGVKAQMRGMMIRLHNVRDETMLRRAIDILSGLAARYQLTEMEAEARLDQARLMMRLPEAASGTRALSYYAMAAVSGYSQFSTPARKEGSRLFQKQLHTLLNKKKWIKAIALWRHFPYLRPAKTIQVRFDIARAYRRIMDFTNAEALLLKIKQTLKSRAGDSLWEQRIMLEMAGIWVERGDKDSVTKIMRWLAAHEDTIYHQDFLLVAAMARIQQKKPSLARQLLSGITPQTLTPVLLPAYWQTRAATDEAMHRWRNAAIDWEKLVELRQNDGKWEYTRFRAQALLHVADYADAERVLLSVPETQRNDAWRLTMAVCAMHTNKPRKAEELLTLIVSGGKNVSTVLRARYLLAIKRSDELIMEQP